jgi:hypothetical protein
VALALCRQLVPGSAIEHLAAGLRCPTVEIRADRVVVVVPQRDFAPFFVQRAVDEGLLAANTSGATDVTPSRKVMCGRKRQESIQHLLSV